MKDYITLKELEEKEEKLIARYNKHIENGNKCLAEHMLVRIEAVRYIIQLIEDRNNK